MTNITSMVESKTSHFVEHGCRIVVKCNIYIHEKIHSLQPLRLNPISNVLLDLLAEGLRAPDSRVTAASY